jgi:hypothetical protein
MTVFEYLIDTVAIEAVGYIEPGNLSILEAGKPAIVCANPYHAVGILME